MHAEARARARRRAGPTDPAHEASRGRRAALCAVAGLLGLACGGAEPPLRVQTVPPATSTRARALESVGRLLYDALSRGRPRELLFDDQALRAVLEPEAASRFGALRATGAHLAFAAEDAAVLRGARFDSICLQGARVEPAHSALGLRGDAWVFDRALVVGRQPSGRRFAAWVEGTFVHTNRGFRAIALDGVETPRWEHADLELASCDMEAGARDPP